MKWSFPRELSLSRSEVEHNYFVLTDNRSDDRRSHYKVVVPRHFKVIDRSSDLPSKTENIVDFARICSSKGPEVELKVRLALLSREISPADWLSIFIEASEEEILYQTQKTAVGGSIPDFLTTSKLGPRQLISRWTAIKNENLLFVVCGRCESKCYEDLAAIFLLINSTFAPVNVSSWPFAEELATFSRAEPVDFLLLYPKTWRIELDAESDEKGLFMRLSNVIGQYVVGDISVSVFPESKVSSRDLVERSWMLLVSEGFSGEMPVIEPASPTRGLPDRLEGRSVVQRRGVDHEILISVGSSGGVRFAVVLAGPARETDAQPWAINRRAYEIVVQQIRSNGGSG